MPASLRPLLLLVLLALTTAAPLHAQDARLRRFGVYVEGAGNGGLLSLNVDVAPTRAIRLRAGGGLVVFWPSTVLTASYLTGSGRSHLEIGAGATIVDFGKDSDGEDWFTVEGGGTRAVAAGIIGYRYEARSGFMARATFTPFYGYGGFVPWFGASAGYRF